jgi:hypothetical protein
MAGIDLSKYIKSIKVESAFLPDIYLPDPFQPGPPSPFLQALKPKITVETNGLGNQTIAPYGEPGPSMWPQIKTALLLATVFYLVRKALK